jgi:hypothetical protein
VTNKKPAGDELPAPAAAPSSDVALIHGPTADGEGLRILRARDNRLEIGAIRPLRDGAPITGEVVTLRPRPSFPALCDVDVSYKPAAVPSDREERRVAVSHHGPAQMATDDYRKNWDAIWSGPASKEKLFN